MENSNILIYQNEKGNIKVDVRFVDGSVWLSQAQICELFGKAKSTISEHISAIFEDGELDRDSVVRNYRTTASDGKNYSVDYYNLDMIIAIGFKARSSTGTKFRVWANEKLKEYITKGFVLNDERFKNGTSMSYFDKESKNITKKDVSVAKNYLNEEEIKLLGLLVEQYLAFAETMAMQQTPMYMKDWIVRLDAVISLNGRELLTHAGKISQTNAKAKSELEYDKYKEVQKEQQKIQSIKELEEDIKRLK